MKRTGRGGGGCTGAVEDDIGGRGAAAMAVALVGLYSVLVYVWSEVSSSAFRFMIIRTGWVRNVGCTRWMSRLVLGPSCGEMQNSSSGLALSLRPVEMGPLQILFICESGGISSPSCSWRFS